MSSATHILQFDGGLLARGFWLYIWEITTPSGETLCYVGRTGDNSSPNAQSPFNRIGQHLGSVSANNQLQKHLERRELLRERCQFRFVAHGPIAAEAPSFAQHRPLRDIAAGLEKELARSLREAGYEVLNTVRCTVKPDLERFRSVRAAFATHFPQLAKMTE